jgi:hypothetical protein
MTQVKTNAHGQTCEETCGAMAKSGWHSALCWTIRETVFNEAPRTRRPQTASPPTAVKRTPAQVATHLLAMVRDECEVLNPDGSSRPLSKELYERIVAYLESDAE